MTDKPYLGYNFASPIGNSSIPQRVQNLCIRDYAQTKKMILSFCVSEYYDVSQSLMLFALIPQLDKISGIIFYSFELLPKNQEKRRFFYKLMRDAGKSIHFALEDLIINSEKDHTTVENMYRISLDPRYLENHRQLLKMCHSTLATIGEYI